MEKIKDLLIKKGVRIPCPESVEIGDGILPALQLLNATAFSGKSLSKLAGS